eukprot:3549679-Pyramimonas_sp.AAC.1
MTGHRPSSCRPRWTSPQLGNVRHRRGRQTTCSEGLSIGIPPSRRISHIWSHWSRRYRLSSTRSSP